MTPHRRPGSPRSARTGGLDEPPLAWDPPMRMVIHWAGQDDPKKNTAKKLQRHHMVRVVDKPNQLPKGAILLDPMAKQALSRADAPIAARHGLTAIDCSWEQVTATYLGARRAMEPRALPYLVAGNPTKYGQPFMLSTAEAMAAALIILGHDDAAREMMRIFPWAKTFFAVNAEPLSDYARCQTSEEIVRAQQAFLPDDAPPQDGPAPS